MEYPKPVMKLSELADLGIPKKLLYQVANMREGPAFKLTRGKNSMWLFNTLQLDKYIQTLKKQCI